jgi:uncharacterized protein (DUF2164 family)
MKNLQTFEDFLREIHTKHFSDGVLDDDLQDNFDSWVQNLDVQEVIDYAENYGRQQYNQGRIDALKEAIEITK